MHLGYQMSGVGHVTPAADHVKPNTNHLVLIDCKPLGGAVLAQ